MTYNVAEAGVSDATHDVQAAVVEQGEEAGLTVSLGGNAVADKAASKAAELIGLAACSLLGTPDRLLHLKLHAGPHRALLFRVLGDCGLHVLGEVAPCLPCGLVCGRVALAA